MQDPTHKVYDIDQDLYLLFEYGLVPDKLYGPFQTEAGRLRRAKALAREHGHEEHQFVKLDVIDGKLKFAGTYGEDDFTKKTKEEA